MFRLASQIDISDLIGSPEIGRAHKCIDASGNFYLVENSRGEIDPETGEIKEYKVTHNKLTGFACDCESGKRGFVSCKKYGVCQHVRISLACAREERIAMLEMTIAQAQKELAELTAVPSQPTPVVEEPKAEEEYNITVNGVRNPPEVIARIKANAAKPQTPAKKMPDLQSKPFNILR